MPHLRARGRIESVRDWSQVPYGGVVDLVYEDKAPYAFTGTVKRVVFDLKLAAHEQEKALHEHHSRETVAVGVAG